MEEPSAQERPVGEEVTLEVRSQDTIARKIGGRRRSSRVNRNKSMSPRLWLADMKRSGRKRRNRTPENKGTVGVSSSQMARRISNRNKSRFNPSPSSDIQGEIFNFGQGLGENGEGLVVPEVPGVQEIEGVGHELEVVAGKRGELLGESCWGRIAVDGAVEKVFDVLSARDNLEEGMLVDGTLEGDRLGVAGENRSVEKVFVDLPQGAYIDGGRLLAIEDVPNDSERKIERDEAPLLLTNESALHLCGNGNEGVNWAEVGEINLHNKIMGDVLPARENLDEGMMVDGPLVRDSLGVSGENRARYVGACEADESSLIITEIDNALDLIEAQPLQNMEFLKAVEMNRVQKSLLETGAGSKGLTWADVGEVNLQKETPQKLIEDFPPLDKESYKSGRNKGMQQEKGGAVNIGGEVKTGSLLNAGTAETSKGNVRVEHKRHLADILRENVNDPFTFEPEKIKKIGIAGVSSGLPSIYFSG